MKLLVRRWASILLVRGSHDAAADAHTTEQMQKEKAAPQVVPKKKKKGTSKTFGTGAQSATLTETEVLDRHSYRYSIWVGSISSQTPPS